MTVGNMYSVGRGVCSWYKTWKALVFARLDRAEEALEAAADAAENSGYFGEMYETNDMETMTVYRPWFTTAAGMLVHAVNEILLQSRDGVIYIAPALPKSVTGFSFKLATCDGIVVETAAENGELKKLIIDGADNAKVVLPSHILWWNVAQSRGR